MSSSENPNVTRIRSIHDPLDRAAAAQEFITNGRRTIDAIQEIRDDAIRTARSTAQKPTVDAIAARIGSKRNVVVDALRGHRN